MLLCGRGVSRVSIIAMNPSPRFEDTASLLHHTTSSSHLNTPTGTAISLDPNLPNQAISVGVQRCNAILRGHFNISTFLPITRSPEQLSK